MIKVGIIANGCEMCGSVKLIKVGEKISIKQTRKSSGRFQRLGKQNASELERSSVLNRIAPAQLTGWDEIIFLQIFQTPFKDPSTPANSYFISLAARLWLTVMLCLKKAIIRNIFNWTKRRFDDERERGVKLFYFTAWCAVRKLF